jgi:hypothetical protein
MRKRDKTGDKKGTRHDPSKDGGMRGRGQSTAEAMGKSTVVSGGYVQSNWQSARVYDRRKATRVHRDHWNKGSLVKWVKP